MFSDIAGCQKMFVCGHQLVMVI